MTRASRWYDVENVFFMCALFWVHIPVDLISQHRLSIMIEIWVASKTAVVYLAENATAIQVIGMHYIRNSISKLNKAVQSALVILKTVAQEGIKMTNKNHEEINMIKCNYITINYLNLRVNPYLTMQIILAFNRSQTYTCISYSFCTMKLGKYIPIRK